MQIPNQYRPVPFWSWNEKLDPEETRRQVRVMHEAGIGGFFMHARGGLQTGYMSEEWFANVEAAVEEAGALGMDAWAYDENGWPSGFGDGKVCGLGVEYQQKHLKMDTECPENGHLIAKVGEYVFYYEVNPFYSDNLDAKVVATFIREIYEPYYARFGNRITGFFTDEPQINSGKMPWSFVLPDAYRKRYGEDLIPLLPELFLRQGDYQTTRIRFWKLVTDLFSESYFKQIYDWCTARGLKFTGHLMAEGSLQAQLRASGAAMPHYEYFSVPGMDWLGRNQNSLLTACQVGSAALQTGKKQVISETFALCGHNVSFDELRSIYAGQMIRGVNLLCPHLQGYSIRGIRKRDYPPAMYYQQPWWPHYKTFCTEVSRVGQLLSEGTCVYDTLLIHPQTTAWTLFDGRPSPELKAYAAYFNTVLDRLEASHVLFHLGDETLMERHGRVENGKLILGEMVYKTVILPDGAVLLENTRRLLARFREEGGIILSPVAVTPRTDVVDNPTIQYTHRKLKNGEMYYFLNSTDQVQKARIGAGNRILDPATEEKKPFLGEYTFAPYETLLILDDGTGREYVKPQLRKTLDLSGQWEVTAASPNVLTLDTCDYYFDDQLQETEGYVLNIQDRAVKLERPVRIRQEFHVQVETVPEEIWLVCETPEIFQISVNGQPVCTNSEKWFLDKSFRMLDIAGMLQEGRNTITMMTDFVQSEAVYECQRGAEVFHNMRNKLTYDMEIETCYLVGSFGVLAEGETTPLERNAFRYRGGFTLCALPKTVTLSQLEKQGFLFFAGNLCLSKNISVTDPDYEILLDKTGIQAVSVAINEHPVGTVLYSGAALDCAGVLRPGRNRISLCLYNTLRNMLGPHHQAEGECYMVGPSNFFKEMCVWSAWPKSEWHDDYCFVEMGIRT